MSTPRLSRIAPGIVALSTMLLLSSCSVAPAPAPAEPAFSGVSGARVVAHLDIAAGQLPENIVSSKAGVAATFAASRQVATISTSGEVDILGTLPAPSGGGSATPVLGFALATGLVEVDGSYYALYATGETDTTGLWKLDETGEFEQIAQLPADGLPNGLAYDEVHDRFLVADSAAGKIYSIDPAGTVETWSDDAGLAPSGFLGANGVQLRDGDLYVSNLDAGTILQIDVESDGTAGEIALVADDLAGVDDFAFTGRGDQIIATLNPSSEVVLVDDDAHTTILTADDGLTNPTSVLVQGDTIYVPSAAYVNQDAPNLLTATLQE